jgi:acyl-CoA dehydrogenase
VLEGAAAWLVGDPNQGFKQMTAMVNQSRLSNGVRSTGMMRRAVHEALSVAVGHRAFGRPLIELPLMRRQLSKLIVPAEAALAICLFAAHCLERADAGDPAAQSMRRILTPLIELRACRDARKVTGDAMEVRGGNGYIEEWIEPRLLREAHPGSIWEGTNIIALDVVRAAAKDKAHRAVAEPLRAMLAGGGDLAERLGERLSAALDLIERAGSTDEQRAARQRQADSIT